MKKILIVSTVSRQFYLFEQGNIRVLKSLGYEVHCAANFNDATERLDNLDIIRHPFEIMRSPFSLKNIKAYKQLKLIMKQENFNAVHCHSPMGGVLARLAAKSLGISTVIYTAHGFHFYKGASIVNWLVYYPVEKFLSRYTDILLTINREDFNRAKKFKAKKVRYIPGIGVETDNLNSQYEQREKKRVELGIAKDTVVLLSIGEMIRRKNYETALNAVANIKTKDFIYLICGKGELEEDLRNLAKTLGIGNKVKFLGFRNDISEICIASDIFIFPSYQEGLPVSVMEAMVGGLPIICSEIRGNTDLIDDGEGGYMLEPKDIKGFTRSIEKVVVDKDLRNKMGKYNINKVKMFDRKNVEKIMNGIYEELSD